MTAYVAIIPGHGDRYREGRDVHDPGAVAARESEHQLITERLEEAAIVRQIAPLLVHHLQALGVPCGIHDAPAPCPAGHPMRQYHRRVREGLRSAAARKATRCVVFHLHLNAGGGCYTLTITDGASPSCRAIADRVDAELRRLAGLGAPRQEATVANFPNANGLREVTWREGAAFAPAVTTHFMVCEAAFIDNKVHQGILSAGGMKPTQPELGLNALAAAIARGLALSLGGR